MCTFDLKGSFMGKEPKKDFEQNSLCWCESEPEFRCWT